MRGGIGFRALRQFHKLAPEDIIQPLQTTIDIPIYDWQRTAWPR